MRPIRLLTVFAILCLLALPNTTYAQWSKVATGLVAKNFLNGGLGMYYREGTVWAGYNRLYYSQDSGTTWKPSGLYADPATDWIVSIRFWDKNYGLVTTYTTAWLTTDGGTTWSDLKPPDFSPGASGCFAGSKDVILLSRGAPGMLLRSTDRGASWQAGTLDSYGWEVLNQGSSAYFWGATFKPVSGSGGTIYKSVDQGITWRPLSVTPLDQACYGFDFDSCGKTGYLVNEGVQNIYDTCSQIFTSSDAGVTWRSTFSVPHEVDSLVGAVAVGHGTVYVPSKNEGVFRSTDQGATWQTIGGPPCQYDVGCICVIDDSTILLIDDQGSVWRTTNSAGVPNGNPYKPASLSTNQLFGAPAAPACGSATASVLIRPQSGAVCTPLTIATQWIEGPDELYYAIAHTAAIDLTHLDSIVILFQPSSSRQHNATLNIQLSDGTLWKVALAGRGADSENVILNTQTISTDTIGEGSLAVHIGRLGISGFDLPISYDSSVLVYEGTFDSHGTRLDIGTPAAGNALIHINGAAGQAVDSLDIIVRFAFYPTAQKCGMVTFGPGRFTPDTTICGSIKATTAQICSGSGCGESFISDFLRYGRRPAFRIAPNPASSTMEITSQEPVTGATIEVLNALGRVELRETADLGRDAFMTNLAGLTPGPKFVRILTAHGAQVLPVLILR